MSEDLSFCTKNVGGGGDDVNDDDDDDGCSLRLHMFQLENKRQRDDREREGSEFHPTATVVSAFVVPGAILSTLYMIQTIGCMQNGQ